MNKHLKIFLSFLSLIALLLGSCKIGDKLGSETQDSQISGEIVINTDIPSWSTNISSTYEGSQISYKKTNDINTSFPSWSTNITSIPEEYRGKYYYLHTKDSVNGYYNKGSDYNDHTAKVTYRTISSYDWKGRVYHTIDVFLKETIYLGNNTWHWNYYGVGDYADTARLSPIFHYIVITKFERNEKGQRVLIENKFIDYDDDSPDGPVNIFVHEDDMNK